MKVKEKKKKKERKSEPNFQHYVQKIQAQEKKKIFYIKKVYILKNPMINP